MINGRLIGFVWRMRLEVTMRPLDASAMKPEAMLSMTPRVMSRIPMRTTEGLTVHWLLGMWWEEYLEERLSSSVDTVTVEAAQVVTVEAESVMLEVLEIGNMLVVIDRKSVV